MTKGYLVLENGQVFEGVRRGALDDVTGEVVFTTGMTGYLETLTDPSYYGQIVVQTFPLIGNYGVIPEDFESGRPRLFGYVARELCGAPSNFRSRGRSRRLSEGGGRPLPDRRGHPRDHPDHPGAGRDERPDHGRGRLPRL